jgi:hypothetical protein
MIRGLTALIVPFASFESFGARKEPHVEAVDTGKQDIIPNIPSLIRNLIALEANTSRAEVARHSSLVATFMAALECDKSLRLAQKLQGTHLIVSGR